MSKVRIKCLRPNSDIGKYISDYSISDIFVKNFSSVDPNNSKKFFYSIDEFRFDIFQYNVNYLYSFKKYPSLVLNPIVSSIYPRNSSHILNEEGEWVDIFSLILKNKSNMNNTSNLAIQTQDIVIASFRDKFMVDYHDTVFNNQLTSVSDFSNNIILEQTVDQIKSLCNVIYYVDHKNRFNNGFEGFIDKHTYFRLTYSIENKHWILNAFFSYHKASIDFFNSFSVIKEPPCIKWCTGVDSSGNLLIDEIPLEVPSVMYDSFYPWLGDLSINQFIDSYLNSSESILLLHSEPGTGKSNLLKYLLWYSGESALITYQDSIRDLDVMFSSFIRGSERFLIIEDADELLLKREQDNKSMKRLLNVTDGLTSNKNKKIIFTSNLTNINQIDKALLRPGRCHSIVEFKLLNLQEALHVAKDLEIDPQLITKDKYTLAEMFSIKNYAEKSRVFKKNSSVSFGFST